MTTKAEYRKLIEKENGSLSEDQWQQLVGLACDNANDSCHDDGHNVNWLHYFKASLESYIWDFPL